MLDTGETVLIKSAQITFLFWVFCFCHDL